MEELKPCPFCGGEAYFRTPTKEKGTAFCIVSVECKQCGASPFATMVYEGEDDVNKKLAAAKHWNRRVNCDSAECEPPYGGKEDCEFYQRGSCSEN